MSKSELLNKDSKRILTHAGNIAYLFYSNLADEKTNYNEIRVKINFDNGISQNFVFSYSELMEIDEIQSNLKEINESISSGNFKNITNYFDPKIGIIENDIESLFSTLQSNYGKINRTQFQGFQFDNIDDYGRVVVISEALVFEKIAATMILVFNKENQKLINIQFP